jgi:hypothetical protein
MIWGVRAPISPAYSSARPVQGPHSYVRSKESLRAVASCYGRTSREFSKEKLNRAASHCDCGITAVFLGFLVMLLFADRFGELASALGFLTALFGAVTGLVGTYFGIKSSSDAREGAQRLAASPAGDTTPPEVTSTSPVDGAVEVPPNIHPTATFSKDMNSATINPDTFKLLDQASSAQVQPRATGGVVYDQPTRRATFTPANPLGSGRTYAATISAAVRDRAGNTLAQDYTWHFTVAGAGE